MTPMQTLVLMEIRRAGAAGVPLEQLERLLADYRELRRLDEPKDPRACVRVTVNQINTSNNHLTSGRRLIQDGRRDDRRYRLER